MGNKQLLGTGCVVLLYCLSAGCKSLETPSVPKREQRGSREATGAKFTVLSEWEGQTFSLVNHSDTSQLWVSVRFGMRKRVDSAFTLPGGWELTALI